MNILWTKWTAVLFALPLLVACGGGGGNSTTTNPAGDGSPTAPMTLTVSSSRSTSVGSYGSSYYSFTTGTYSGSYVISLTNTQTDLSWDLYPNSSYFTPLLFRCDNLLVAGNEICSTTLSSGTTYWLSVDNWDNAPSTYTVKVAPLDYTLGCSAGAAQCFSFETGTVPGSFAMSGNASWAAGISTAATGTYSLRSGAITDSQTTCFSYTPSISTSTVAFSVKTDTEAGFDILLLTIDSNTVQSGTWSGSAPWTRVIFSSLPGAHTYRWCYTKDASVSVGQDSVWIDDIEFN